MRWLALAALALLGYFMLTKSAAQKIASAIAQLEGFGTPGAIPTDYNNPGDLEQWPGYPVGARGNGLITQFPDPATGWAALLTDIETHVGLNPLQSVSDFGDGYSGTPGYGQQLAALLGVAPGTPLEALA